MTEPVVRPAVRGSDYAELSRLVREAGLLDRRPRYYAIKITVLAPIHRSRPGHQLRRSPPRPARRPALSPSRPASLP